MRGTQKMQNRYEAFVLKFLAFFVLFPALVAGFNWSVDPNHRYRFSVPAEWLGRLASSEDLVLELPENYDDRALLKKFVPEAVSARILVLGGSRVLNIQSEMFRKESGPLLNEAVMAGTIRDYVSLWQLAKQSGHRPKFVFICVEEQSINTISQNDRYLSIYEYFNAFYSSSLSLRRNLMGVMTNLKDLLSLETTLASLKILSGHRSAGAELVPREGYDPARHAKTHSFSMLYPLAYEVRTPAQTRPMAQGNGAGEIKVFEKWNPLDRRGYQHLSALIRDIQKNGGQPIIIGMPYHPEAYQMIRANERAYRNLQVFVEELKKIGVKEKVTFYDAIETHHAEFEADDFLDGVHLKMPDNYRLFRNADQAAGLGVTSSDFEVDNDGRVKRQKA